MLRKKGLELSEVFKGILAKPQKSSKHEGKKPDLDGASVTSSAQTLRDKTRLKKRGYVEVPALGQDPDHDQRERKLIRLATKGVVQMLNTVSRMHKERQIHNKEAVPTGRSRPKDNRKQTTFDETEESEDAFSDGGEWEVLQDAFLEKSEEDPSGSGDWNESVVGSESDVLDSEHSSP